MCVCVCVCMCVCMCVWGGGVIKRREVCLSPLHIKLGVESVEYGCVCTCVCVCVTRDEMPWCL